MAHLTADPIPTTPGDSYLSDGEASIGAIADWGPAEDWSDWGDDAAR